MKIRFLVACLLALAAGAQVHAADCVKDQYGNVVCGRGQCATDQYGKVQCLGGCQSAAKQFCEEAR